MTEQINDNQSTNKASETVNKSYICVRIIYCIDNETEHTTINRVNYSSKKRHS